MAQHPLLNRRDVTAERLAADAPAQPDDVGRGDLAAVAAELAVTNHLLQRLLTGERADVAQLCVSDREPPELVMDNFPVPGARRLITRRSGNGGTFAVLANTPLLILAANENRLGGKIVNAGAGGVTLVLDVDLLEPGSATPLSAGSPQIWLPPTPATGAPSSWDLMLGRLLWCGNVIAVPSANTTLTIAEV